MNGKFNLKAALLLPLLFAASCVHERYQQPLVANATIEATAPVWIRAIDGKKVSLFGKKSQTHLRILPGLHTLRVDYYGTEIVRGRDGREKKVTYSGLSYLDIKFMAKAGHNYVVGAERGEAKVKAWVTEFSNTNPK